MKPITIALAWVGGGIAFVGLIIFLRVWGIADTKYLGTAQENANREVYENTKVYRDGVQRDMDELSLSYAQAKTADEKATVLSIMRHRAEGVPHELIPSNARQILGLP